GLRGGRWRLPHRAAPALSIDDRYVRYQRDDLTVREQNIAIEERQVRLPRTGVLDLVLAEVQKGGRTLGGLRDLLTRRLPTAARSQAVRYLDRLADEQLLVPIAPVDPQAVDPLPGLARWARAQRLGELADLLQTL